MLFITSRFTFYKQFLVWKYFCIPFLCLCFLIALPQLTFADEQEDDYLGIPETGFFNQVSADYRRYYSGSAVTQMLVAFGVAGVFANTSIDGNFLKNYSENHNGDADRLFDNSNDFGDYSQLNYSVPLYLGAMWLGQSLLRNSGGKAGIVETWGNRSLRTLLLGAPQQLVLSYATGANRPEEGGSGWNPFHDNNGVSGHAFFGAVPLITAAQMTTNKFAKYSLYAASVLPGLARINNEKHYLSQALLGWSLAYFSSNAVFYGDQEDDTNIGVYTKGRDIFLGIEINF